MSAAYSEPVVTLDPAARRAHVEFSIQDDSAEPWPANDGWAVGFHLFDAENGTLIVDGARAALNLKPGESARLSFDVDIPEEDGRYQIVFSPMREGVCWYYDRGWPFLLLEAAVRDGAVDLGGPHIRTHSALSRARNLRSLGRAFRYPFLTAFRNRNLIRTMVRRDILGRYRGSFGGSFWTVFNPLLLMLTYFFVFGVVLTENKADKTDFAFYFLSGMLPWLAFSEAVGRAPTLLLEHKNFVKKLVFAVETLPVNLVAAGLVTEFFAIILFTVFLAAIRHSVPSAMIWLPALLIPQILLTAGICWFLSALGLRPRPRPDHRLPSHHLVLHHPHLLPRLAPGRGGAVDAPQESHLHSGERLPRDLPRQPGAALRPALEALGCYHSLCASLATRGFINCASPSRMFSSGLRSRNDDYAWP